MANEFKHITKGTSLTQAEFEHIDLHACNSQATGDLIYASSSSQLSRLAIGTTNKLLTVIGGVPTWQSTLAGLTLTSPTINGTIATTGLTLPAVTLGGAINANSQEINLLNAITGRTNNALLIYGKRTDNDVAIDIYTPGVTPGFADTERVWITGRTALGAICSWRNGTVQENLKLGGNMTGTGYSITGLVNITGGTGYHEFTEMAAPGAGAANTARIYAVVGGDTLTDVAAVFQDGTVDIFAQETTPLDSPIFTQPSGTTIVRKMVKPHPGIIQFVETFPDGKTFVTKELQYHDAEKIAANKGCTSSKLPEGWEVTTAEERLAKAEVEKLEVEASE